MPESFVKKNRKHILRVLFPISFRGFLEWEVRVFDVCNQASSQGASAWVFCFSDMEQSKKTFSQKNITNGLSIMYYFKIPANI
jgi:hypothetical protein